MNLDDNLFDENSNQGTELETLDSLEFSENSDPRIPVALVLDLSDSMMQVRPGETRSPFDALNGGLDALWTSLHTDPLAKRRAEVTFIPFGTAPAEPTPFATVDNLQLPQLEPMGITALGAAMMAAIDAVEARQSEYRANGIASYKPLVILITDGLATDDTTAAGERIRDLNDRKKMTILPIAVEGADTAALQSMFGKSAAKLSGTKFEELFVWLSASVAAVSASQPGDAVKTPPLDDWAEL